MIYLYNPITTIEIALKTLLKRPLEAYLVFLAVRAPITYPCAPGLLLATTASRISALRGIVVAMHFVSFVMSFRYARPTVPKANPRNCRTPASKKHANTPSYQKHT